MTPSIELGTEEFLADPYATYQLIRETGAPYWYTHRGISGGMWLFTTYEDVVALLKEARVSKHVASLMSPEELTPLEYSVLFQDPPDHTRLRGLIHQAFTPARVRDLEQRITQIVEELIDRVEPNGSMDFIKDFAFPLPIIVIADLLGIPPADHDLFRRWSKMIIEGVDIARATEETGRAYEEAMRALIAYFTDLIARRRVEPQNDILSALIAVRDAEGQEGMSENEILGAAILLLVAGHETTVNLLGNGLYTLLRFPDQMTLLRERPELLPTAVEEMLRFESPVQRGTFRFTRTEFLINGAYIGPNQQVSAVIGAANRDPAAFPDPDRFDITREPNRHLAFGYGIHFCMGAALARAEARIGFSHLLQRMPNLHVDPNVLKAPRWQPSGSFRCLQTLPVSF